MSQANYIIICRGRIDVASTSDPVAKIRHASSCAAQLVSHIEITRPGELPETDAKSISDLQHLMMNSLPDVKRLDAESMVNDMFTKLDTLEKKLRR